MRDSKWFKEGVEAFVTSVQQGRAPDTCPYGARSAKALIWEEGFKREQHNPNIKRLVDSATPVA
jgi:hypothetical protein